MVRYRGVGTPCYDSLKRYFLLCLNLGQKWCGLLHLLWYLTDFFHLFPKLHTVETSSDSNVWFLTSQLVFWKLQQVFTSRQYCSVVNFSPGCMKLLSTQIMYDRLKFVPTDGNNSINPFLDLETLFLPSLKSV